MVTTQVIPHAFGRETKNREASAGGDPPSNCLWASAAMFPIPIMDEAVVTFGSNIYSFGGISEGKGVPNAYRFDGTMWTPIAPYPSACGVESASAVTDGTFIYIMNGNTFCPLTYSTDVYRYNPSTDTYTQLSSTSVGTWNQTAVYLNGKIYKMGGKNAAGYQTALEIYDTVTDTWSFGVPLPEPTGFASSFTLNGLIYIAGGVVASGVATNAIFAYDPVAQTWISLSGLPHALGRGERSLRRHCRHGWWIGGWRRRHERFGVRDFRGWRMGAFAGHAREARAHERCGLGRKFLCHRWIQFCG
jgi:N-acetylneuraminic acid mutarotase